MKQIVCEICESTDFVKADGMFTCQGCGTKYSAAEVKNLMREVEGEAPKASVPAQTANSEELDNLYQLARRAKDSDNSESAAKYYDMILMKDPNSWEANYYAVYYKSMCCKIGQIQSAISKVENCIEETFRLITTYVKDDAAKVAAVKEVIENTESIAKMMERAYERHYEDIAPSIKNKYTMERLGVMIATATAQSKPYMCMFHTLSDDDYFMTNYGCEALRRFLVGRDKWEHAEKAKGILAKYDAIAEEKKRKEEEEKRRIQEERNNKYWQEHAAEKASLEQKKADLEDKAAKLTAHIDATNKKNQPKIEQLKKDKNNPIPAELAVENQKKLIADLTNERASLGLFQGKQKKAIDARLQDTEQPKLTQLKSEAEKARKAHNDQIAQQIDDLRNEITNPSNLLQQCQDCIAKLTEELTKDR